jgi:hypothetical protein
MPRSTRETTRTRSSSRRNLRICIDRVVPARFQPARAADERAAEDTVERVVRLAGERAAARLPRAGVERIAIATRNMWDNGRVLRCRFMDGDATQRRRVEEKAHIWEEFVNVRFRFVRRGEAEIRISFTADTGSWSALGTDALVEGYFPDYQPTMNFGWLEADTDDQEYERVVLHEFGHALGCIHEHQSPGATLKWKKSEVYRVFSGWPNFWTKEDIDHNILSRYTRTQTNFTEFDPDSIMLYEFPGPLFTDGNGTKGNATLSRRDKEFMAQMYPK